MTRKELVCIVCPNGCQLVVDIEGEGQERFVKEVMRHPEVLECYATSGEADFHLRVVAEDIDAYNAFLDDFIFRLPGVSQVRSNIVLKEIKADTALPFRTS